MSHDCYVSSTPFRLSSDTSPEEVQKLLDSEMDYYRLDLVLYEDGLEGQKFILEREVTQVGGLFAQRIRDLVAEMSSLVKDGFAVTVRADSMSDDRDEMIYGGPTPEAIEQAKASYLAQAAFDALQDNVLARELLLQRLSSDPEDTQGMDDLVRSIRPTN